MFPSREFYKANYENEILVLKKGVIYPKGLVENTWVKLNSQGIPEETKEKRKVFCL